MYESIEVLQNSTVPGFLLKLWSLVEDKETDDFICWDINGTSFHLRDQIRFSKQVLPVYFKHSNISSFIRQLNMYGFRKVVHINSGIKNENNDLEFQHPFFQKGQESLLEFIKRKPVQSKVADDFLKITNNNNLSKLYQNVKNISAKQELISNQFDNMKQENENLWREVTNLRQKNMRQQQILNKLIQFLIAVVGKQNRQIPSTSSSMKRKLPMILDKDEVLQPNKKHYQNDNKLTQDLPLLDGFLIEEVDSPNVKVDDVPLITEQDLEPELTTENDITSKSPKTKENLETASTFNKNDKSIQLKQGVDNMQYDLDALKDLLSSQNLDMFDQNVFSNDDPFTISLPNELRDPTVQPNDDNQIIKYSTPSSFKDLENIFENDTLNDDDSQFENLKTPFLDDAISTDFTSENTYID